MSEKPRHQTEPTELPPTGVRRSVAWLLAFGGVLLAAAWIAQVSPLAVFSQDARTQMWAFIADGIPPAVTREYLLGRSFRDGLLWAVVETLAISIVGTTLAVVLAVPLALVSTATVTYRGPLYAGVSPSRRAVGRMLNRTGRFVLSFLRSVPELVWGFLFVTAVGLGPFAGVLALGIHNAGVLGKLYADFLEDTDPKTTEAIAASGATRLQAVCHGMVPQLSPTLASYTLYRWECTIRSASVLGFVGAGGIGYYLLITIQRLQYRRLLTAIGELAEIFDCLERTDVDLRDISLDEAIESDPETITADIRIGVPVLSEITFCEGVSLRTGETELTEEKLELELSVSVPTGKHTDGLLSAAPGSSVSTTAIATRDTAVPSYKDPDTLKAVYEKYDSFTEMTEALGVDVTSETVRRYMIQFDIHDPTGSSTTGESDPTPESASERDTDEGVSTSMDTEESDNSADPGGLSVAEVFTTADREADEELPIADGFGLPKELAIKELTEIVEASRTVSEVKRSLGIDYDDTRRLLEECGLLESVTGRLSAEQEELTPTEVYRRVSCTETAGA